MYLSKIKKYLPIIEEYETLALEIKGLSDLAEKIINEDDYYSSTDFNVVIKESDKKLNGISNVYYKDNPKEIAEHIVASEPTDFFEALRYMHDFRKEQIKKDKIKTLDFTFQNNEFLLIIGTIISFRKNRMDALGSKLTKAGFDIK